MDVGGSRQQGYACVRARPGNRNGVSRAREGDTSEVRSQGMGEIVSEGFAWDPHTVEAGDGGSHRRALPSWAYLARSANIWESEISAPSFIFGA